MSDERRDVVLFDTTVFGSDWLLEAPAASFVMHKARSGRLHLIVPDLVLREAAHVYRRHFGASQRALREAVRAQRRFPVGGDGQSLEDIDVDLDPQVAADDYERRLREQLDAANAEVVALPDIDHHALVSRALSGDPPFDADGRTGYRDALIWHSVLEAVAEYGSLAFISANSGDFAASKKRPNELARRLQEDVASLRGVGCANPQVRLRSTPGEFVAQDCPIAEQSLVELRERLKRDREFRRRVGEQLDGGWVASWPDWEVDGDIGVEWDDMELDMVGDLRDFDVEFTSAANDTESFVALSGHADIQVRYTLRAASVFENRANDDLDGVDWNDRTGTGTWIDVVPARLDFEALYRPGGAALTNVKLIKIREDWQAVDEGRVLGGPVKQPWR